MSALSAAARSVWAKSLNSQGFWLPLWQHMDDAADVAGGLFDRWLSGIQVGLLAQPFGGDAVAARTAVRFLAGMHDLGKATPAFAVQDEVLATRMRELGLSMPETRAGLLDRSQLHHSLAGHHLLVRWLRERGWSRRPVGTWGVIVGGHHGVPTESMSIAEVSPQSYPHLYGQGLWEQVQRELADRHAARTGADQYLDQWCEVRLPQVFQVVVSGLVILADWIASNESLLPFLAGELPEVADDPQRGAEAMRLLALPPPWQPGEIPADVRDLFQTRFRFPAGATPRPVQEATCRVASGASSPGLVIVEAPMGEGKTEAALAAAEILAHRWGCGGLFVALPTQATTDAMFGRVIDWLDALGSGQQPVGAVTLSHGKAHMNRLFQGLVRAGRLVEIGCDEDTSSDSGAPQHSVVAHAWLSGRKKSQLANFTVGTIDQLLFAGLKARHLVLRHLALAGKVVVIDEVHAYDAFMNSYLTKVLMWLGAYGVPVLALSATLPLDRRRALLQAYREGAALAPSPIEEDIPDAEDDTSYPVITWTDGPDVASRAVAASGRSTQVSVEALAGGVDDDLGPLIDLLTERLSEGGCVVVLRNTVRRVLRTAQGLREVFGDDVSVAHSRFIVADRLRLDGRLLDWFGPAGRSTRRPHRHIVVASQVVEQSLDVDFDLLVTDLAPIDLVLQRMGRLHRHERGPGQCERPPKLRAAQTSITGADFTAEPPVLEPGAARFVYHRHPLLRAAAVLTPRFGGTVALPDDIAPLVRAAYGPDPIGPESWRPEMQRAQEDWLSSIESRVVAAETFQVAPPGKPGTAILNWVSGSVGEADDEAGGQGQVRDGTPSLEAVLVQKMPSGVWCTPCWLPGGDGGREIPREGIPPEPVASILLTCTLRLPMSLSNEATEAILRASAPEAWQQSPLLYRLPMLIVDADGRGCIGDRTIRYTPELGLEEEPEP